MREKAKKNLPFPEYGLYLDMTKTEAIATAKKRSAEYDHKDDAIFVIEFGGKFHQYHCEAYTGSTQISSVWKKGKRTSVPVWAKKMREFRQSL